MSEIQPFEFDGRPVRVFDRDGIPWFVGKDVADVLGYADPNDALQKHCKSLKKFNSGELTELGLVNPPPSGLLMIQESDLYRLIMRSKLPAAERFESWVVGEVLPAIRKHGRFDAKPALPRPDASGAAKLIELTLTALPNLGERARQCLISTTTKLVLGEPIVPLPVIEQKHYTTTEIAQELGVNPSLAGRIANQRGLKVPGNGENRLSKSLHSPKQVEQWHWTPEGRIALIEAITGSKVQ